MEPNGGREKEALLELSRIARKYLVLIEPAYEYASEKGKERMDLHGYVKNLPDVAIRGSRDVEITGVSSDSKLIAPGNLYVQGLTTTVKFDF